MLPPTPPPGPKQSLETGEDEQRPTDLVRVTTRILVVFNLLSAAYGLYEYLRLLDYCGSLGISPGCLGGGGRLWLVISVGFWLMVNAALGTFWLPSWVDRREERDRQRATST